MHIKGFVKNILNKCGIDVRELTPSRSDAARMKLILNHCNIELVIDVGANIGQYATYLRAVGYTGRILCFEPLASAHAMLKKRVARDYLIELAPKMALGDFDGEIEMNVAGNSESSSILPMLDSHLTASPLSKYTGNEKVQIRRLDSVIDDFVKPFKNLLLKIDAQGYEKQVLLGSLQSLQQIKAIQLELSIVQLYQGEPLYREMIDMLESLGYELYDLNPNFADNVTGRVYQVDAVFVHESVNNAVFAPKNEYI